MTDVVLAFRRRVEPEIIALFTTFVVVQFLFFIDEGYYDFRWMMEWGNWVVFGIYFVIGYPVFWAASKFLFPKLDGVGKVIVDAGVAVIVVIVFLLLL